MNSNIEVLNNYLTRDELVNRFYGYHRRINIGTAENVTYYLKEVSDFLNKYQFSSNQGFSLCIKKNAKYEEIKKATSEREINHESIVFILNTLEEFMSMSNKKSNDEFDIDASLEQIDEEYICLEEKECIDLLINSIYKYLDNNVNKNLDTVIDEMITKAKNLPRGSETSISKLIGDGALYKFNDKELFEITKLFYDKCNKENIVLDFSKYSNQFVGLPYNIPFEKNSY